MDRKDGRWIPRIADFGLARPVSAQTLNLSASPGYAAPEQLTGGTVLVTPGLAATAR